MGEINTGVDGIQAFLSGAAWDGGAQDDVRLSLGGKRSRGRAVSLVALRQSVMRNIRIVFVSGLSGPGFGSVVASGTSALRWSAPGGTLGAAVMIANGESKALYGGGSDGDKYVVVSRTDATPLAGVETVQLLEVVNNVVGGSNFDGGESAAGEEKYRGLIFKNLSAGTVTGLTVWIDPAFDTHVRIAKETTVADAVQTIANEETQPAGLSWVSPTTEGTGLALGTLAAGATVGLWIERYVGAGASADPNVTTVIRYSFSDGNARAGSLRGMSRVAQNGIEGWCFYLAEDAEPDINASPTEFSASLPFQLATVLAVGHTYRLRKRFRNRYGLVGAATDTEVFPIAADASLQGVVPSAPAIVNAYASAAGKARVVAAYFGDADVGQGRATKWLVYARGDGVVPDPAVDTPAVVAMFGSAAEQLEYTTTAGWLEDAPVRVLVRVRRVDGEDPDEVNRDSANTAATAFAAEWWGPERPSGLLSQGRARAMQQLPPAAPDEVIWIDQAKNIYWRMESGSTELWADTVLIWNLKFDSTNPNDSAASGWFSSFGMSGVPAVSGTGTGVVEVISWTGGDKRIGINVSDGTTVSRRMVIDVTNEAILMDGLDGVTAPSTTRASVACWGKYLSTCFQVWDPGMADYVTVMSLMGDGVVRSLVGFGGEV